jgi:beta-lactam-binding protein with PASTA domain
VVQVNSASLAGQPVDVASNQLRQLGLAVRVVMPPSGQDPGTVLTVQPSGPVPVRSVITITAAVPLHHHGHGHGHGQGGDNGNGGD